jgi:CubicO group peptidase (beta-lactamase class C family)
MDRCAPQDRFSRRAAIRTGAGAALVAAAEALLPRATQAASPYTAAPVAADSDSGQDADALFRELDAKIEAPMAQNDIPGVAVGVLYQGHEHLRGFGVTNRNYPLPVDGDTLFRIGSITKTFTATIVMRLVEQRLLDLDTPVRTYLPDLTLADEPVAAAVTLRQLLDHSAGFSGQYYPDTGRGADAISRYVAGMVDVPQLTPLGQVFSYNNTSVVLAGRVIEAVTGQSYEAVVRDLVLDPLGLDHTFFNADEFVGYNVAASHTTVDGVSVVNPPAWRLWRSLYPTGGLVSSARDLLRYARFHLHDGAGVEGPSVLSAASVRAMRTQLGPGGTDGCEIDGVGVNWFQRRTAEGVPVYYWPGSWAGQYSSLMFIPDRGFAFTLQTNADSAESLRTSLTATGDWLLEHFAGLHNPPAVPQTLTAAQLAPYEGRYTFQVIDPPQGVTGTVETALVIRSADGGLRVRLASGDSNPELEPELGNTVSETQAAFYRDNYVILLDANGQPTDDRADFLPGPNGDIAWFRLNGNLYRHMN